MRGCFSSTSVKLGEAPSVTLCKNCGAAIRPHRACVKCGYYKGNNVVNNEETE